MAGELMDAKLQGKLVVKALSYRAFAIASELMVVWAWSRSLSVVLMVAPAITIASLGRTVIYWFWDNISGKITHLFGPGGKKESTLIENESVRTATGAE
ncbi:MAG: DUF2061 domain-containing protein [Candidatus Thermoplasmatota archaeon]|nr:DUF2061 domain-containing protein [Candidatus Thermoplasmatota archaeon]